MLPSGRHWRRIRARIGGHELLHYRRVGGHHERRYLDGTDGDQSGGFPPSSDHALFCLTDSFSVTAEETRHLALRFDTTCQEDAPGEVFGRHYRVVLEVFEENDVTDATAAQPLLPARINPQYMSLEGTPFQIIAP